MKKVFIIILLLCSFAVADDFTSDLLPDSDSFLSIGTNDLRWLKGWFDEIDSTKLSDGVWSTTGGVQTGLVSLTDGTASWSGSSLSGFSSISGTTLTDKIFSVTGGNFTGVGNISGVDIDISAGTGSFTGSGTSTFGQIINSGLTASKVVFTDGSKQLTSTAITLGDGVFWNRTGTVLSPITADDDVNTIGTITATTFTDGTMSITGGVMTGLTIDGAWSWTGVSTADWTDAAKVINTTPSVNSFMITSNGKNYIDISSAPAAESLNFGDNHNPAFNFSGSGLTTLGGNLLVNGGFIGITADDDLIQLANGALTVNGTINAGVATLTGVILGDNEKIEIGVGGLSGALGADSMLYSDGTNTILQIESPSGTFTNPKLIFTYYDLFGITAHVPVIMGEEGFLILDHTLYVKDITGAADGFIFIPDKADDNTNFFILFDSTNDNAEFNTQGTDVEMNFNPTGDFNISLDSGKVFTVGDGTNGLTVGVDGDTFWEGAGTGLPGGGISVQDNTTATTISSSGKVNKVQFLMFDTDDPGNLVTSRAASDGDIKIIKAGVYMITVSLSVESSAGDGDLLGFSVYLNNGTTELTNVHTHRDFTAGAAKTGSLVMAGRAILAVDDTVEVWGWNEDDTDNFLAEDATLTISMVGGT